MRPSDRYPINFNESNNYPITITDVNIYFRNKDNCILHTVYNITIIDVNILLPEPLIGGEGADKFLMRRFVGRNTC